MGQSRRTIKRCRRGSNDGLEKNATIEEEHPAWKIPEILEHIFKYCDVECLKMCGLVSKSWRQSSINTLRSSSIVVSYGAPPSNPTKETDSLSSFIKFLSASTYQNGTTLYENFELRIPSAVLESKNLYTFWKLCGRNIMGNEQMEPSLQEVAEFPTNHNLKSLTINCKGRIGITISWLELLGHFPGLEELKLTNGPRKETVAEVFTAINLIRKVDPHNLNIRHIRARIASNEAGEQMPDSLAKFLVDPSIQLESLSLNISSSDGGLTLKQIFSAQGSTLKTLILGRDKDLTFLDPMKVFPLLINNQKGQEDKLINLKELRLQSRVFTGMEFLKFLPNMEKHFINDPNTHQAAGIIPATNLCNMKNVKLSSCVQLELVNSIYPEDLTQVMTWLPNIERLKMPLNNKTFALVCQNWQNMTSLEITCCRVTESGFTGMDSEQVEIIHSTEVSVRGTIPAAQKPNISHLKHLRTLRMEDNRMQSTSSLGYAAAILGILQLPCLNLVEIKRIPFDPEILLESFRKFSRLDEVEYRKIVT